MPRAACSRNLNPIDAMTRTVVVRHSPKPPGEPGELLRIDDGDAMIADAVRTCQRVFRAPEQPLERH